MADKKKSKEVKKSAPVKPVAPSKQNNTRLALICVAVITLITYLVYTPSLNDEFTNWDDPFYVQNNPLVVSNSVPLVKILETPFAGNYHPITFLSLALNYQSGKLDPSGYHQENLFFHLLNTILVFLFIFLLTRRNLLMAAIVSLFFGVHPMHVESVAWVTERKDVLYVFFFMAGLITYLRYSETKKTKWYIFTFLLFILSCLSKGMGVVFPVILLLIDYLKGVKWERRLLMEKIPFFILSIVIAFVDSRTMSDVQAGFGVKTFTLIQRVMFASYGAVMYIVKLFIPFKLSAFYQYPDTTAGTGIPLIFYVSPIIILGIAAAIIYFFLKKEKEIVFGLLFYFVSVVLVLQLITTGTTIMADRYSYLSYVGLLFIVAYLINKAWQSKKGVLASLKYPFVIVAIICAVAFGVQAYSRTQVWKNSETLWTDVINNYPDVSIVYYNRAKYYNSVKEKDKAMSDYTKSIELDSTYSDAYIDRANIYNDYGKSNLALADYNKAVKFDPYSVKGYYDRGLLYMNKFHNNDLAIADFTKTVKLDSTAAYAYNDRGSLYFEEDKKNLALADITKAIELNPANAQYYYNRGLCYKATNDFVKALRDISQAIQLNPQTPSIYYYNEGFCNGMLNNNSEAIVNLSQAIQLNPSDADYWQLRSTLESKIGQTDKSKADAIKAQQLQNGGK